jgi:hypothetical protein
MKKKLLFLVFALAFNFSNAQQVTFKQVSESTKRIKGKITSYVTSMGDTINIGDKVKFGVPSNTNNYFVHVRSFVAFSKSDPVSIKAQGWESEVLKMLISGSKRRGYVVSFISKTEDGFARYSYDYEDALSVGEIVTDKLNRTQAIAKLKESKDLLDLGMVSQEDFNALRKELTPIIMNKN